MQCKQFSCIHQYMWIEVNEADISVLWVKHLFSEYNAQRDHTYKTVQRMKSVKLFFCVCVNYVFIDYLKSSQFILVLASIFIEQILFHVYSWGSFFFLSSMCLVYSRAHCGWGNWFTDIHNTLHIRALSSLDWFTAAWLHLITDITTSSPSQPSNPNIVECTVFILSSWFKQRRARESKDAGMCDSYGSYTVQ